MRSSRYRIHLGFGGLALVAGITAGCMSSEPAPVLQFPEGTKVPEPVKGGAKVDLGSGETSQGDPSDYTKPLSK